MSTFEIVLVIILMIMTTISMIKDEWDRATFYLILLLVVLFAAKFIT